MHWYSAKAQGLHSPHAFIPVQQMLKWVSDREPIQALLCSAARSQNDFNLLFSLASDLIPFCSPHYSSSWREHCDFQLYEAPWSGAPVFPLHWASL